MKRNGGIGAFLIFAALAVAAFVAIDYFTGREALGAAVRFLWNGLAYAINGLIRLFSELLGLLARGVGWRRLTRIATAFAGVGLGYSASLVLDDEAVGKARGWRDKAKAALTILRNRWQALHLAWKLVIVAALIASQVYLHSLLIIFPIAFLVPVVKRLWIRTADLLFGSWYWRTFGRLHRATLAALRSLPVLSHGIGAVRLARIRYLCAWRLWKYDPRYRDPETQERWVSLIEPIRLWWRGHLDIYVERPLLAGRRGEIGGSCRQATAPAPATDSSALPGVP
jgi:hypothetical protein